MNSTMSLPLAQHTLPGILDVSRQELRQWLLQQGEKPWRAQQIHRWLLQGRSTTFDAMSDLPKQLREQLPQHYAHFSCQVDRHLQSTDETHKLLLRLADGKRIECVLIQDANRRTACISTQVGCGMGCVFCASGLNGMERNLTVGEILEQLVLLRNLTPPHERLTHIVVMGMGEPLANLDRLLQALAIATDPEGLGISARHVTISTVGLPAKIRELATTGKAYHLAVSLHAPNDLLRSEIVPTNAGIGIQAILEAADAFYAQTKRQVTYEYVVLGQYNDQPTHVSELIRLLLGRKAHVNLIPWNEVSGLPYRRPTEHDLNYFINELRQHGISVKVRKRKGADIDAACGQLRRQAELGAIPSTQG